MSVCLCVGFVFSYSLASSILLQCELHLYMGDGLFLKCWYIIQYLLCMHYMCAVMFVCGLCVLLLALVVNASLTSGMFACMFWICWCAECIMFLHVWAFVLVFKIANGLFFFLPICHRDTRYWPAVLMCCWFCLRTPLAARYPPLCCLCLCCLARLHW